MMTVVDASSFVRAEEGNVAIVLVYVDDLIVIGDWYGGVDQVRKNLCTRFHMKDLGDPKHFLGLELNY